MTNFGYRSAVATPTLALALCSSASLARMSGRWRTSSDGSRSGSSRRQAQVGKRDRRDARPRRADRPSGPRGRWTGLRILRAQRRQRSLRSAPTSAALIPHRRPARRRPRSYRCSAIDELLPLRREDRLGRVRSARRAPLAGSPWRRRCSRASAARLRARSPGSRPRPPAPRARAACRRRCRTSYETSDAEREDVERAGIRRLRESRTSPGRCAAARRPRSRRRADTCRAGARRAQLAAPAPGARARLVERRAVGERALHERVELAATRTPSTTRRECRGATSVHAAAHGPGDVAIDGRRIRRAEVGTDRAARAAMRSERGATARSQSSVLR